MVALGDFCEDYCFRYMCSSLLCITCGLYSLFSLGLDKSGFLLILTTPKYNWMSLYLGSLIFNLSGIAVHPQV